MATLILRTSVIDRVTGIPAITEQKWSGQVGFVEHLQQPRNDQIVASDAWLLTDQSLHDKTEVHCRGKAYKVIKLAQFDGYSVASLAAVAPADVHLSFANYQEHSVEVAEVPEGTTYLALGDQHEPVDEMSGVVI